MFLLIFKIFDQCCLPFPFMAIFKDIQGHGNIILVLYRLSFQTKLFNWFLTLSGSISVSKSKSLLLLHTTEYRICPREQLVPGEHSPCACTLHGIVLTLRHRVPLNSPFRSSPNVILFTGQ